MSHSSDDDILQTLPSPLQSNKKRRIQNQRACDRCRQKKIRCDGTPSSSKCSHCLSSGSDCIFTESTKARGPPKRYVDSLETRLEKMEGMLSRLYPDGDFSQEMELDGWARSFQPESTEDRSLPQKNTSSSKGGSPLGSSFPVSKTPASDGDDSSYDSDADSALPLDLQDHFKRLCLRPNPRRYFGKSSSVSLLRTARDAKSKASSGESPAVYPEERRSAHRDEFWSLHPWELDRVQPTKRHYDFPEPDLLTSLVAIYFKILAPMMPLLHRPTFMNAFDNGLHFKDDKFGALVLLVCAAASKYSQDSRTLLEGGHLHSAGWKWFRQVEPFPTSVLATPELYDLQIVVLSVIFIQGALPPHEAWIMVGVGLRLAQDVGAHRRQLHHGPPTIEDELWKRAFWVLLMYDIWSSSYLGRPCAISEESYDVDLPIECDDEYWENPDPTLAFKQPPGKPSQVAFFNHLIKINILHSHALRTIYSLNKSRFMNGPREKGWQEHTVTSLDSALNSWFDSIPDHLGWDPQRENQTFFVQSASLRIAYYFIQITIHRPFIPSFRKEGSLSFPALAICASAARACSHVADALRKRYPILSAPNIQFPTFVSGVVLLLSLWGAKRSGTSPDPARDMQDVRNCTKLLELAESRWPVAGRLRDLLTDLSAAGELPIPAASPPSNKREREDSDDERQQSPSISQTQVQQPQRPMSLTSTPYSPVSTAQDDFSSRHTSIHLGAEFASYPTATPVSAPVPSAVLQSEVSQDTFSPSAHSAPSNNVVPMLLPRPYSGSYRPLGGSSGLGRAAPAIGLPTSAPAPATATFGPIASLSGTAAFTAPPTMHGNDQGALTSTTGPGGALSPGMGIVLKNGGLYDLTASATTPVSASASSSSSPQTGFRRPSADFRAGDGPEAFDMTGMEMAFGGYGVPPADKEAMLRNFAPLLLQDGQIGVDRDTMMMWSTMPSTYETQEWETYMSSIMGMANTNATDPSVGINVGGL